MTSISFLKFAAAIMELLEPGRYLKPAPTQPVIQATFNSVTLTDVPSDAVSSAFEPAATLIEESTTIDIVAEHITQQFTQFDNSKDVVVNPLNLLSKNEATFASEAQLEIDIQPRIESELSLLPASIAEDLSKYPTPASLIQNAPQNSFDQATVLSIIEEVETIADSVAPAPIAELAAELTEQLLVGEIVAPVEVAASFKNQSDSANSLLNDNEKSAVSDVALVANQTIEKRSRVYEATSEKESLPLESNQFGKANESSLALPSVKESAAQPTSNLVNLPPEPSAAQSLAVESNQDAAVAVEVEQIAVEPQSFWDLYRDIDESEIKYLSAVIYLYNYMTDRAMNAFLNPAIDIDRRQRVMTKVSGMANNNMRMEAITDEAVQKNAEQQQERIRELKREEIEEGRRLQFEMQLRQRIERQKFEERIFEQRRKEAKEQLSSGK